MLACQACRDLKSLFLGGWLRLGRVAGLPFGYPFWTLFHFEWQGGGFSFCVLYGTATENVFGDQVAGFTALLLSLHVSSTDLIFDRSSGFVQIRAGLLFHPDAFWGGRDVWEGVQSLVQPLLLL